MPAIHIRDVSEKTVAAIKERAAARGPSVQRELRQALDRLADVALAVTGVQRVMVDTNVFLAATDTSRHIHRAAVRPLNEDKRAHGIAAEHPRVPRGATRPVEVNGLGLSGAEAAANLGELLESIEIVHETGHPAARSPGRSSDAT